MRSITHYIDDQVIDGIKNMDDFEIVIDFELEQGDESSQTIELTGSANEFVRDIIDQGTQGGVGIFEGIPYRVEIVEDGEVYNYEAFIDLGKETEFYGDSEMSCKVNRKQGENWLNDVADGFSLITMKQDGEIVDSDYTEVSYSINYGPDALQIASLSISVGVLTIELLRLIKEAVELKGNITADSIPLTGFGIVINVPRIVWNTVNMILRIAYIIALLIGLAAMVKQLLDLCIPRKGTYKGLSVKRMFELGLKHLDLKLQSSLLEQNKDLTYFPVKANKADETRTIQEFQTFNSFGDVVRAFKMLFNADFRIDGNTFIFERVDYFQQPGSFVMPDIFSDQEALRNDFTYNTDEFISNYNINFRIDPTDGNTLDATDDLSYQSSLTPITVKDKKLVTMKGLTQLDVPFSLAIRKSDLTDSELMGQELGRALDIMTGIFGKGTRYYSSIKENDGAMLLSNDYFSVAKLAYVNNKKISKTLSAKLLWDNYHFVNSFSPNYKRPNQWKIHSETRIPISTANVNALLENNSGLMPNGNVMIVNKLIWKPAEDVALITYREQVTYTTNIKETKS